MPIVVDPYLIAIPNSADLTAERVRAYAQSLATWEKEFVKRSQEYVISSHAYATIQREGLVPTMSTLQQLFDRHGIEEYSSRDIVPDCTTFLANCAYLEEESGAFDIDEDIEPVPGSELIIPEEMRWRLSPAIAEAFVDALISAAYALEMHHTTLGWSIATAPLSSAEPGSSLRTTAVVRTLDGTSADIVDSAIQRDWPLLVEPDYLYASYNVFDYWDSPLMATRIVWCRQKAQGSIMGQVDWTAVRFGKHFTESLADARIRRRPNLQQDIQEVYFMVVSVILGMPFGSSKHHALRNPVWMHSAPVQKRQVRTSDGATRYDEAARVEVTSGAAPLRLHYWRCYDGTREFSNVTCDHDDPTIYGD